MTRTIKHKGKENEVFSKMIRTPFDVLLTFVPKKQKSLHYLSFRQTVAHQEGNLISTERSEWRNLFRKFLSQYEANLQLTISKTAVIQARPFDFAIASLKEVHFVLLFPLIFQIKNPQLILWVLDYLICFLHSSFLLENFLDIWWWFLFLFSFPTLWQVS